jgi:hypothetical protein
MTPNDLATSFPDNIQLPSELHALCQWLETHGYPISGHFEMQVHSDETLKNWFGSDKAAGYLACFGQNGDGSLYCLWKQDDGRLPVVHLGSEGQNNVVLASNALEFLRLLAIGYNEIGFEDLSAPPEGNGVNPAFQNWLITTFNTPIPKTGNEIVLPAQTSYENFQAWIEPRIG